MTTIGEGVSDRIYVRQSLEGKKYLEKELSLFIECFVLDRKHII